MTTSNTPISRNAKHILTEDEVEAIKETLLGALQSKKEIEAEKKEVANTYKTKIAEQELAIDKASNLLRVGYEHRPFQCYLVKNFDEAKRQYFEFGTDKLIDTEPLNAADYQTEMEITEKAIKENNEAADLLHSGKPEYTVEPESNPLEFEDTPADLFEPPVYGDAPTEENEWQPDFKEETPAVEPEVIDKPKKEVKSKVVKIEPTPIEDEPDPFGMDDEEEQEEDPFQFGDI
jgi:hypothetical protein